MKVTKEDLNKEKARLFKETEECHDCKIERELGFYYCDYHKAVIKYLKNHIEVEYTDDEYKKDLIKQMGDE